MSLQTPLPKQTLLRRNQALLPLFDATTAWAGLSETEQAAIGVAAIVLATGALGADCDVMGAAAYATAEHEAQAALVDRVVAACLPDGLLSGPPDLAAIAIRACHVCGCTEAFPCHGGCSWVGPNLCTRCRTVPPESVQRAGNSRRSAVA